MIFKSLVNISLKNFIRDKKNLFNILLLGLTFALIMLCLSFAKSLHNYWNESVKKLIDYRTYVVTFDRNKYNVTTAIEKLESYEHVIKAYDESSYLISMKVTDKKITAKDNNSILLIGTLSNPIKLVEGTDLNSVQKNERPIICAKQFYPYLEKKQKDYITKKSIDITDKVGKNINLSFITGKEKEKFKIVGLYDAKENHTHGNVCYTTTDIVHDLNYKYQSDVFFNSTSDPNFVYMIIDNLDNEKAMAQELQKAGFNIALPTLHINKDMGIRVIMFMFIISGIIIISSFVTILMLAIRKLKRRKINYSILRATGYSSIKVTVIYIGELIFEFIFSFLCSFVLYYIMIIFFQKFYLSEKIVFYNLKIELNNLAIFINVMLSFVICIILLLYFKYQMKRKTIKNLAK